MAKLKCQICGKPILLVENKFGSRVVNIKDHENCLYNPLKEGKGKSKNKK